MKTGTIFTWFKSILFKIIYICMQLIQPLLPTGNIFYLMEFREIFLTLLRKFDERMQPRSFLRDLVESTHLFLRMLERFCKGRNNLLVQVSKMRPENPGENSMENWSYWQLFLSEDIYRLSAYYTETFVLLPNLLKKS